MRHQLLTLTIYLAALIMPLLQSCTNDGDIGHLYGQWALRSYTVDGTNADIPLDEYYWQFQSDIVCIVKVLPYNDYLYSFGTWQISADMLLLNFTHTADDEIPESSAYNPPPELGIPARAITKMTIQTMTTNHLVVSYTDDTGIQRVYSLEKLK